MTRYFFSKDKTIMVDLETVRYYEIVRCEDGRKCCEVNGRGSPTPFYNDDCDSFVKAFSEYVEGK